MSSILIYLTTSERLSTALHWRMLNTQVFLPVTSVHKDGSSLLNNGGAHSTAQLHKTENKTQDLSAMYVFMILQKYSLFVMSFIVLFLVGISYVLELKW